HRPCIRTIVDCPHAPSLINQKSAEICRNAPFTKSRPARSVWPFAKPLCALREQRQDVFDRSSIRAIFFPTIPTYQTLRSKIHYVPIPCACAISLGRWQRRCREQIADDWKRMSRQSTSD